MTEDIKVSIVIPAFNSQTWLPHAVQSALEQSYENIEVVIVNDGSSDRTEQYLKWLEAKNDSRIKIARTSGLGRSKARNLGNSISTGNLILVLDADDLAAPNRAKLSVSKYINTGAPFIYGSASIIDAIGRKGGEIRAEPFNLKKALETKMNYIVHSTVAYTKQFALDNPYPDGEPARLGLDDWSQQIQAAVKGVKMEVIAQTISAYRILASGISKTRDEEEVKKFKDSFLSEISPSFSDKTSEEVAGAAV